MSNEHNPIALLISQLQTKWNSEVTPYDHLKLIRWLIIPEQARLYEGFLKLESTASGSLPDMIVVLLTPFTSPKTHSEKLIKDWIEAFRKDEKTREALAENHPEFNWDPDSYEKRISENTEANNALLLEMAVAFQQALPDKDRTFTFGLFPYSVEEPKEYGKWVTQLIARGMPEKTRIMMFDFSDERYFDSLFKSHEPIAKSLSVPLDLDGAVAKITGAGDPNKPDVQFRKCMMKMSKAVSDGSLPKLHEWGKKGIEAAQRSGLRSFMATARIVYAGMLFSFKEFEAIDDLLLKALAQAKQGLDAGDENCKPILIQCYGFQASSKQMQKKKEDAANLFCKQADTALEFGFPQQPLTAWWLAYSAIKKKDADEYKKLVIKAYEYGAEQEKETLKSTCMAFVAADYYNILDKDSKREDCQRIDDFMKELEGENWRDDLEKRRKEMEKRKFSLSNWF